jgi:phage-related holin
MKNGMLKKVMEFFLLISLILGQRVMEFGGVKLPVSEVFGTAFAFKELGSILENAIAMGVAVPAPILKWFKESKIKIGGEENVRGTGQHTGEDNSPPQC